MADGHFHDKQSGPAYDCFSPLSFSAGSKAHHLNFFQRAISVGLGEHRQLDHDIDITLTDGETFSSVGLGTS